ncbi:ATP-binding protein [Sphingomonas sp. NFR15]|uniref:ATP-binding protein n=1 Tax=Sphingomonas sp. NFR15 TaxID=1566282 RepID=UPI0008894A2D|nr:ATP-binding protein [Sphingomonas sp. NFR15]SDA15809.1 PAS domain S-box-containing protein [Sphingomonas sp. NFR15]
MIDTIIEPSDPEAGWSRLAAASERLATTRSLGEVVAVLRETARAIVGAEGIAVVVREAGTCFYAAEDAVGPLWAGKRFPIESCVSGWAMLHQETVVIPDIRTDDRIPRDAYSPTFVRSLAMAAIGRPEPIAAIGAYWSRTGEPDPAVVARLEALARSAAIAIENARLLASIRESDRQREMALAAGRMGVWSLDLPSRALKTSAMCRITFGRDPDQDFSFAELRAAIHPDDRERVFATIWESIANANDCDLEHRVVTAAGETCWVAIRAQPTYAADGTPLMLAGVSVDITARQRMEEALRDSAATLEHLVAERTRELIKTQEALRQSQKLEAMGQLTGGVAHDFNNLLTPIIGSLDLLQRRAVGGAREQRLISGAIESADRAKTLVQRLLAFARRQPLNPGAIDVATLLIEMSTLIGTTIGPQISLRLDIAEDLPLAHADANQVEMAILNLAVNARDAMPEGGTLTIAAKLDSAGRDHRAGLSEGQYILLSVADTGTGMDETTRARAIEPFFSTKGVGRGTGLGLSMAHGLALQLGGALALDSAVGAGTLIELWLPVSNVAVLAVAAVPAEAAPHRHSGTALLVDDENLVRATTADMLTDLGFTVIEARSGEEALALLDANPDIDILVTDHVMPHMTGAELARAATARRPGLRVLVVSGYSDAGGLSPDLPRLEKPFRQADLALHIAAAMQMPAAASV